jgi:hypothetical protein
MRNRLSLTCLAAASLALAAVFIGHAPAPALAHPVGPRFPYTVSAEDEWGHPLRTFHQDEQTFVLGTYGQRYNLRVSNHTGVRVEAVVTVDGRDVVSGRVGNFVSERGYVIDAHSSLQIEGFRRSHAEVAAFRFTDPGDSYSSRMGTPEHVGVIGVAFFPERRRPAPQPRPYLARPYDDARSSTQSAPRRESGLGTYGGAGRGDGAHRAAGAPSASASTDGERRTKSAGAYDRSAPVANLESDESTSHLGTEYGETRESQVREVAFRRANLRTPALVLALRYDDARGLLARGIQVNPPRPRYYHEYYASEPNPFPENRFAPPPP